MGIVVMLGDSCEELDRLIALVRERAGVAATLVGAVDQSVGTGQGWNHDRMHSGETVTSGAQQTASVDRLSAAGSAAAALVAFMLLLGLHVLRSDLDPASHRLSEYALGPWGWLMTLAFLSAATGAWLLRRALPASDELRPARALLAIAAAGFAVSALVPTDPLRPDAVREAVHSAASAGALLASTAATLWTVTISVEALDWRRALGPARAAATVAAVGALLGPLVHDGPWTGAVQRMSVGALFVWLLLVCVAVGRGRSHRPPARS